MTPGIPPLDGASLMNNEAGKDREFEKSEGANGVVISLLS